MHMYVHRYMYIHIYTHIVISLAFVSGTDWFMCLFYDQPRGRINLNTGRSFPTRKYVNLLAASDGLAARLPHNDEKTLCALQDIRKASRHAQ